MTKNNFTPINPNDNDNNGTDHLSISRSIKEGEPISPLEKKQYVEIQETAEYEPNPDLQYYFQKRHENIELPPDLKQTGIKTVTATPQYATYKTVKLPISDDKVIKGLHAPITSSFRWIATLAIYILKKAHLSLKIIKGRVMRVKR